MFKNKRELVSHGFCEGREAVLEIMKAAINSVNSYEATMKKIRLEENTLFISDLCYDLSEIENVYIIGGGKATLSIAQALEEILGERISDGAINVKEKDRDLDRITVTEAGHPVPNEEGLEGAKKITEIAEKAKKNDLVICAITGGASALIPTPEEKISLEYLKKINKLLLNSGAPLEDMNTVRKHISKTKGGKLAKMINPAEIVNLIIIDEISGEPWGPTVPDETTFEDAIKVLKKHKLWEKSPESVKNYLKKGVKNKELETLNFSDFKKLRSQNIILGDNKAMCESAEKKAEELGLNSLILTTKLEGEGGEVGTAFASIGKEIVENNRPLEIPCAIIAGGETPIALEEENSGKGGPSQEFVLKSSLKIANYERIVIGSIDTDGTDGPTNIAGGLVDGETVKRAEDKNIDIHENLVNHNSSFVLSELGDAIFTEPTETNVMNLYMIVVL